MTRVHEAEPFHPARDGLHERGGGGGIECIEGGVVTDVRHRGQQVEVELATDHRRQGEDSLHLLAEVGDPSAHHVARGHRQPDGAQIRPRRPPTGRVAADGAGLRQVSERLGGEERVTVGLGEEHVAQEPPVVVELVSHGHFEQLHQLVPTQAVE